ncbi:MAG: hypothetical protein NC409_12770 [Clostridium sp.]|nr:hypothetical protein [Clostridium sp.]
MIITERSQKHLDVAMSKELMPEEIVAFFSSDFQIRTFSDVISRLYIKEDLEERLIEAIGSDRTVKNWLHDRNLPVSRESAFQIAFALGLDEIRANELFLYLFGEGIHYRDETELIYAFALKNDQSYEAAKRTAAAFRDREKYREESGEPVTSVIRTAFTEVSSGEDLIAFILSHNMDFGRRRNTAYRYFMEMLSYLKGGEDGEDGACSIEYVTECYLRMGMPENRKTQQYDVLQRMIKKYWPGLRSIKAMKNRKEDVSRKTLLLLYIVTGGIEKDDYDETDEEYINDDDLLLAHCRKLKKMMQDCNMRYLDPRNPFDFLVLYSLNAGREGVMSERMEEIIRRIFV